MFTSDTFGEFDLMRSDTTDLDSDSIFTWYINELDTEDTYLYTIAHYTTLIGVLQRSYDQVLLLLNQQAKLSKLHLPPVPEFCAYT